LRIFSSLRFLNGSNYRAAFIAFNHGDIAANDPFMHPQTLDLRSPMRNGCRYLTIRVHALKYMGEMREARRLKPTHGPYSRRVG